MTCFDKLDACWVETRVENWAVSMVDDWVGQRGWQQVEKKGATRDICSVVMTAVDLVEQKE